MRPNTVILNPIFIPGVVPHLLRDSRIYVQELFSVVNMSEQQHQCWDQWESVNQAIDEQYPDLDYDIIGDITNEVIKGAINEFDQLKSIMRDLEQKEGGYCDFVVMVVDPTCIAVEVTMYAPF
nr:MAG: hypothetical protein [Bacteriophage sp.]